MTTLAVCADSRQLGKQFMPLRYVAVKPIKQNLAQLLNIRNLG